MVMDDWVSSGNRLRWGLHLKRRNRAAELQLIRIDIACDTNERALRGHLLACHVCRTADGVAELAALIADPESLALNICLVQDRAVVMLCYPHQRVYVGNVDYRAAGCLRDVRN